MADLREILQLGLAHGGELLTAGERALIERILALQGPAASLYARLTARRPEVFHVPSLQVRRVDDLPAALEILRQNALVDGLVPWPERAKQLRRTELVAACRKLGLPAAGRRSALAERLAPHRGYVRGPWVRVRHRGLLLRMLRLAFLKPRPERSTLVVARLGVVRWPDYPLTKGAGAFRSRRAMLAWEVLLAGLQQEGEGALEPEAALEALDRGAGLGGAGLDLRPWLVGAVREGALQAERAGQPALAERWYRALVEGGHLRPSKVAVRRARALEKLGQPQQALAVVRQAVGGALPSEQIALRRAGRRLARSLKTGFPPARPLLQPRVRSLKLAPCDKRGARPLWRGPQGEALLVEPAVLAHLASLGRRSLYAEGIPWCTLATALCAELYFLPVEGALPVRFLSAPLDLGTAAFRARRAEAASALLLALARGEGPALAEQADRRWRGTRLAGARWDLVDRDTLLELARAIGPQGLACLVEAFLERGPVEAAGLPDLVVLPGDRVKLELAWPGWVPEGLLLVEIKGPGDTVRDEQRVWHDRLLRANVSVELWEIGP